MIYEKLTPMEYLDFVAGLWAVDTDLAAARARDLLSRLGLAPHAGERCEQLSKGMRQKVALGRSSTCWPGSAERAGSALMRSLPYCRWLRSQPRS
jgi:ABC-type multidrug transport system ATPase subunit